MKKYPCRCRKCKARVTLKNHPDWYETEIKCRICGGKLFLDSYRKNTEIVKNKCTCDGYHFPHNKNSKWCKQYKGVLTQEDYEQRYGSDVIKTDAFLGIPSNPDDGKTIPF